MERVLIPLHFSRRMPMKKGKKKTAKRKRKGGSRLLDKAVKIAALIAVAIKLVQFILDNI